MSTLYMLEAVIFMVTIIAFFLSTSKSFSFKKRIGFLGITLFFQIFAVPVEFILRQNYIVSIGLFAILGLKTALVFIEEIQKTFKNKEKIC